MDVSAPPGFRDRGFDHALQRLERSTGAIWLVQRKPRLTDVDSGSRPLLPESLCVKRHAKEIRRGDRIVLWLSGAHAGVYALGEVTADVLPAVPRAARGDAPAAVTEASVDLFLDLFDRPVGRTLLKTDPRFADASILRQPFAANPHRLSVSAFDAILERVGRSGSTAI